MYAHWVELVAPVALKALGVRAGVDGNRRKVDGI
jgi:hypothetical protein